MSHQNDLTRLDRRLDALQDQFRQFAIIHDQILSEMLEVLKQINSAVRHAAYNK